MQLISINVGKAQPIKVKSGQSGIYKMPVSGRVQVTALGLVGDAICDVESHGGVAITKRIGITLAADEPLRFVLRDNGHTSRPNKSA